MKVNTDQHFYIELTCPGMHARLVQLFSANGALKLVCYTSRPFWADTVKRERLIPNTKYLTTVEVTEAEFNRYATLATAMLKVSLSDIGQMAMDDLFEKWEQANPDSMIEGFVPTGD